MSLAKLEEARPVLARVRGVVFDVDDTLTTQGKLHPNALAALWRIQDSGLRAIAVTGRPLGWTDAYAMQWPIDAAVGENGAGWAFVHRGALQKGYFHSAATRARHREQVQALSELALNELPSLRLASDQPARRCDLAFDVNEACQLMRPEREELDAMIRRSGARALWSSVHAHALFGDWDKARGVLRAAMACGVATSDELENEWVFVGDSGNDSDAFAFFKISVGVANVRRHLDRLSALPAYVTQAEAGEGFSELVQTMLEARGG